MTQKRIPLVAVVVLAAALVVAGCGAGPSVRPDVAVEQDSPGQPAETSDSAAPQPPGLQAPITDLNWADCTEDTLSLYGVQSTTPGLTFECASYEAPVDVSGVMFGSFGVGALRARLAQTPPDAAPLVLTSGADRSSGGVLASIATGQGTALLAAHPIVAIDRRGTGRSTAVDCVGQDARAPLADLGQFTVSSGDAADRAAAVGRQATIECTDILQPQELAFASDYAADDLDQLRIAWGVDTLGIIATGNGTLTALAYAAKYPGTLSRLVLDTPVGVDTDQTTLAEQRTQGREAAFDAFAGRCVALGCSLGANPRAAVQDLLRRSAGGEFAPLSTHAILDALTYALASTSGDASRRTLELSNALSAAAASDRAALTALASRARTAFGTDGQFVSRCTDGRQWPSPQSVRDVQAAWAERYPLFGSDALLTALTCSSWPTAPAAPLPSTIDVPVLALSGAADPIVGNGGFPSLTGLVSSTGAALASINWQGTGHPALGGSACSAAAAVAYAADLTLPPNGTACPA